MVGKHLTDTGGHARDDGGTGQNHSGSIADRRGNVTHDAVMALDEAKGREELAEKLAVMPGMTTDQLRDLLAAAPDKSGNAGYMNNAFDAFMQSHLAPISGGKGHSNDTETTLLG